MIGRSRWLPSSGCYPCPIGVKLAQRWAGINPLSGFSRVGRGYFSVPLSTWYIPFPLSGQFRRFVSAEVDNDDLPRLFATFEHELFHNALNKMPLKQYIRFAAAKAYQALAEIMFKGDDMAWRKLQRCNATIETLISTTALVEELLVTFEGISALRKHASEGLVDLDIGSIDRAEEELVQVSANNYFGSTFEKLYRKLGVIYQQVGIGPIAILATYAQQWFGLEELVQSKGDRPRKVVQETSVTRLERCLRTLGEMRHLPSEARSWTIGDWSDFFSRWILDFNHWVHSQGELEEFTWQGLGECDKWFKELVPGLGGMANPVVAAGRLADARTPDVSDATVVPLSVPPPGLWERLDPTLWGESADSREKLTEQFYTAQKRNRTLVALVFPQGEARFGFLPHFTDDAVPAEALPYVIHMGAGEYKNMGALLLFFTNLLFYEGLRTAVATGHGMRCPLHAMRRSPICCGRYDSIVRVWEAGRKAADRGEFSPHRWEKPAKCGPARSDLDQCPD